ncbi:TPA: porin [Vibrio parahaemolyticus]|uniref:oligogalacturonate-specific porin KdgM family protein n=2 Tax=Vibrio parahaemolyticus TaxID=670 RepID=UPI0003F9789F|nr:oligogalacturonate-specific porin KdgM family protein [Vibrio parahaemolyticus]AOV91439.1 porin [Vibrio parahaemolyticus]EGQ8533787.1 porin [Vibrio parahaemolyticus]MBE3790280.1 porin [Vibrio parahaemolyticus]TNY53450.1 porin [Vibrio parahaemolyticus]TPB04882.1 porin [Vibrio parahaemolyticus]
MKVRYLTSALLLAMTSGLAAAASVDIRHEYVPDRDGDEHRDRIYVSHRFDNQIGFSVEAKWNYKDGHMGNAGHETGVSYRWKATDNFSLTPGINIDASPSGASVFKYNLTGAYKINDEWDVAARIRHGYKNTDDSRYNQLNLYANRKFEWGKLGVEAEYKDIHGGEGGWKDKGHDQLIDFKGEYTKLESGVIPFFAIAAITHKGDGSEYKDEYVPRFRVGLKYNF